MTARDANGNVVDEHAHLFVEVERDAPDFTPPSPAIMRLVREAIEGMAAKVAGEWDGPRYRDRTEHDFVSTRDALCQLASVRMDGWSQKIVSDPSKLKRQDDLQGGGKGGLRPDTADVGHRQVELLAPVIKALAEAYPSPWRLGVTLEPWQCVSLLMVRYVGQKPVGEVCDWGRERFAPELTERITSLVTRHGYDAIDGYLRDRDLVPPRRRGARERTQEVYMAGEALPFDLNGWAQIADALNVDERTARKYEREQGLPVKRVLGQVRANTDELRAWVRALADKGAA